MAAGAAALVLVLAAFAAVQASQWLLRWRAERLMREMHQIRLYQSTWADAERLMHEWGAWGHYDGTCTAADCRYVIELTDVQWSDRQTSHSAWVDWLMLHDRLDLLSRLGGRRAKAFGAFTVHTGAIWRESMGVAISVPRWQDTEKPIYEKTLWARADSRQKLRNARDNPWVLGDDEQLAEHPYYKMGRPGGCKVNCQAAVVTFSTRAPTEEIEQLSSYDLSCLTRYFACQTLEEILPAARPWRLYHEDEGAPAGTGDRASRGSCRIPLWALARDQQNVLLGEFPGRISRYDEDRSLATVHFLGALKGEVRSPAELRPAAFVSSFQGEAAYPPIPGKRYILMPLEDYRGRTENVGKDVPAVELPRCGVWEDTPANRAEVARGMAMNDDLRGPERW
ncbi:MAG: hypothetical protein WCE75_09100 [Terracidiphilus sp.]